MVFHNLKECLQNWDKWRKITSQVLKEIILMFLCRFTFWRQILINCSIFRLLGTDHSIFEPLVFIIYASNTRKNLMSATKCWYTPIKNPWPSKKCKDSFKNLLTSMCFCVWCLEMRHLMHRPSIPFLREKLSVTRIFRLEISGTFLMHYGLCAKPSRKNSRC